VITGDIAAFRVEFLKFSSLRSDAMAQRNGPTITTSLSKRLETRTTL